MKLPKQYRLARAPWTEFPDWRHVEYLGWWLSLAPEVPLLRVLSDEGETIGLIIGWVIWRERLLRDGDTVQSATQTHGLAGEYDELGGRFVCFFRCGDQLAVITDAGGMMSLVYSAERDMLASTPAVIQHSGRLQRDETVCKAFNQGRPETWFPFGITPFSGVRRLLPNHRLTPADWRSVRIFPCPGGEGLRGDPHQSVEWIARSIAGWIRGNIRALVNAGHNVAHLTGGFDSRMALAASRDFIGDMHFQTLSMPGTRPQLDCHIAANLAERYSLNYRALDFIPPARQEIDAWLQRTGHCIEDTVAAICATARIHNNHCHEITGTCGEAMRLPFWYAGDDQRVSLSTRDFLRRLDFPENEVTTRYTEEWLSTLPADISVGNTLDIAYVEQRVACWAGPSMFGHDIALPSISPFSSARYYKAILSLPETLRARKLLAPKVVEFLWPELLQVPVNRADGLAKLRFISQELRLMLPIQVRDNIKRLLLWLQGDDQSVLKKTRS